MPRALKTNPAGERAVAPRRRSLRIHSPGWFTAAALLATAAAVPLLVIVGHLLVPQQEVWKHLAQNVLATLVANTALLLACIVPLTAVMGVGLGWLTGVCEYPGRRFFAWALVLPFAIPPYVFAFVYLGLFDFTGPVQAAMRSLFPSMGFIDIRNGFGVAAILSLAFYPYVYLMARTAFMTQGRTAMEAARTLGMKPSRAFFKVALPMARPFVAAGLMLVCMESLADFGAVSIFNYDTFTNAIYKAWFGLFSLESAAQLSSVLAIFVLTILVLEQRMRARMRYTEAGRSCHAGRIKLTGTGKWAAFAASLLVFLLGFGIPCVQLGIWAWEVVGPDALRYLQYSMRTLTLGLTGAFVTVVCAMVLSFAKRNDPGTITTWTSRVATLGYALPGTVLAVGVFMAASWMDDWLLAGVGWIAEAEPAPILQGSLGLLIAAYVIRFLAAGFGSVDSAMQRITPSIGEAARSMGVTGHAVLRRVYLPMLNKGLMTGAILVLVDIMKEMPVTLMMRPFGWDTLAVKIYEYTSEGEWELAALPAVVLILVGLLPVLLLTRQSERQS